MGTFINIGNAGFQRIRRSEYIDKSELISVVNSALFTRQCFSCVTRCRRFGKSMTAEMLCAYYDHSCDSRSLFADLAIANDPSFEEQQAVLNNQVYFAVKEFIERYNAEHQYSLILTTSGVTNTVLNVNPGLDITADVLKGLNEEYIKNRNNTPEE